MSNLRRGSGLAASGTGRFLPAATILGSALLTALPVPLAWGVMPQLGLLFLFIWASIQPRLVPAWGALLLGLATDLLLGLPIGIWTLIYPLVAAAVRLAETRLEGRHSLAVDWGLAALLVVAAHLLAWQFLGFAGRAPALLPLLAQAAVTVLAYPLVALVAAHLQDRLIGGGR